MATSDEIVRRINEFAEQLCEEFEVDASDGDCWLDAVENRAIEVGDAVSAALLARKATDRRCVHEESSCPQCGQSGRYVGDRQRELISRRGPVTITEPEYFCPCCRKAFFPADPSDRR